MRTQGKVFQADEQPRACAKPWRQRGRERQGVEVKGGGGHILGGGQQEAPGRTEG